MSADNPEAPPHGLTAAAGDYSRKVQDVLRRALEAEQENIATAAALLAGRFARDGLLYIFGSGHSHVFAEEGFYRAGGSARICPILKPPYMLHESASHSTRLERESGHAQTVLAGYDLDPDVDTMLVVSNSGTNALPAEVAQEAGRRGLPVIAVTSRTYATASAQPGPRLHDMADVVIDNHCPTGDALATIQEGLTVGPGSSVVGLALLNTLIVETMARETAEGATPSVFRSAGLPGAREHNAELTAQLRQRIPHL